ncbi:MAG: hypothetical protein IJB78_04180 [Oscillospiraceae bacterium]|nr:hypothetical protein [Oscillospiraceae bacterium]
MIETIMTNAVELTGSLLMMLIGLLGTWLSLKMAKQQELKALSAAVNQAIAMARLTVDELQQTVVDGIKAERADGRLTKQEVSMLSMQLWEKTVEKMSAPAVELLEAAKVDLKALIQGAGEAWIREMQEREGRV